MHREPHMNSSLSKQLGVVVVGIFGCVVTGTDVVEPASPDEEAGEL